MEFLEKSLLPYTPENSNREYNPKEVIDKAITEQFGQWVFDSKENATDKINLEKKSPEEKTKLINKNKRLKIAQKICKIALVINQIACPLALIGGLIGIISFTPLAVSLAVIPVSLAIFAIISIKAGNAQKNKHVFADENFTRFMDRYRGDYINDDRIFDTKLHRIYSAWKQGIKRELHRIPPSVSKAQYDKTDAGLKEAWKVLREAAGYKEVR